MKWLLALLFPIQLLAQVQMLPPGTYRLLKPTHPLVLDTGSYTFINLEMKNLGKGIWLDARKARSLTLSHCRFEGNGSGTAVATNNHASITNCIFKKLEKGIWATVLPKPSKKKPQSRNGNTFTGLDYGIMVPTGTSGATPYSITGNIFDGNKNGVYLGSGQFNLELKCNVFSQTTPIPTGNTHFGLVIGESANLYQNRLGGSPGTAPVGSPNANSWPLNSLTWNSTTTPTTIDGFVSIWNQTEDDIEYWKYDNEFFGAVSNTNGGSILPQTLSGGNQETYVYSAKDLCQRSSDFCGETDLPDCIQAVQANNSCPGYTFPIEINWVRACEGSVVDVVDWPIYVPKPTIPLGDLLTKQLTIEIQPDLQLGIGKPNPANKIIQIPYFLPEKSGKAEFWVTEVSTGKLKEVIKLEKVGPGMLEINLDGYNNGVFAYKLIPEKGKASQTLKFVVIQ